MKFDIRLKLIAFTFCIVLLVGGSISLYSIYQGRQRIFTAFDKDARTVTTLIAGTIVNDLYFLNVNSLGRRLKSARVNPDISATYVTDLAGVVLTDGTGENALRDQRLTDPFSQQMLRSEGWISGVEGRVLNVGGPVFMTDGSRIGHLQVEFSLDSAYETLRHQTRTRLYITLICLGIGAFLAVIVSVSFSRPILSIVRAAKEIGEGKLDARLSISRSDELGALAESINQMAEGLQTRQAEAKQAEEKLQARYRELQTLQDISQTILSSPDLKTILEKVLDQTLSITGLDVGNIRLLEPTGGMVLGTYRGYRDPENIDRHHTGTKGVADAGLVVPLVIASRKSRQFEDVWTTEGLRTFKREGVRSAVVVPISTEEEALGVIEAGSRTPRKFRAEEVRLIEAIGNQVGLAVQKARLFEEGRKQAADLAQTNRELRRKEEIQKLLKELSQDITSLDIDSLLKKITEKIRDFFRVDICDVRIIEKGVYRLVGVSGIEPERIRGTETNRGRSKWIMQNRRAIVIPDLTQGSHVAGGKTTRGLGIRGYLAVPLLSRGGEVVGLLRALSYQPRDFTQAEVDLVQQLANGAAIAIENARLFEETKGSLERIRLLREIDTAIASTLDLHALLDLLLEKIDSALPYVTAATIRLLNSDTGELEPAACRNLDVDEWKTSAGRRSRGPGNWVLEKRAPVVVHNVQAGPRILDREFFRKYGLVSYVGVPLIAEDEVIGVIGFYTREEREFTGEELEFLSTLAGQAAIAIHKCQLYEAMARSNRVKDEFLSVMSHELRTPLTSLMGYMGMMQDKILGKLTREQETALEKMAGGSKALLTLIETIMEATKIETGAIVVERNAANLTEALESLRLAYDRSVGKEIALIWDHPNDLPTINTDAAKLKQILQHLINNAIKFTEKGGVTVSARLKEGNRQQEIGNRKKEPSNSTHASRLSPLALFGYVEFKVADTGIGIPKEVIPLIFDKFRQVDSSETRAYGGVGLGLYIVKTFTELLGGKIEVQSDLGKGSTFTVTLPCQGERAASAKEKRLGA